MPDTLPPVKIVKIKDLIRPDPRNANKHTERGSCMVSESIQQDGPGRSVLVDAAGQLIAGELTTETAVKCGIEEAIVVQSDGTRLVAVQRVDVESGTDRAARLGIADNRSAEVSIDWDGETLQALQEDGLDLSAFWREEELAALVSGGKNIVDPPEDFQEYGETIETSFCCPKCGYKWSGSPS